MRPFCDELRLLPNPVNADAYEARVRRTAEPRLVWLRSFHEIYNPSLAPRVVALLAGEFPDIRLTMVGRDKGDGSLQRTHEVAAGLCVVSTNVGGVPHLLEDGRDALLVAPRDAGAMAAAVRRLLTDAPLAERLS